MECFACIHCHFYQPPRENPWLEAIETQDSAAPYHDWNQRIAAECYLANGASRILDSEGRIRKIVNNYSRVSFNFGPTLLAWMEQREPETYQRILDGDRESILRFSGHGSALAQAYNHIILPLANPRDKRTQILWGIKDFQRRFRRDPEGMWLPETAVDLETLEILSAEGIKFTILSPRQAKQLRIDKASPWIDLEYGIDSRRAYKCDLASGRSIGLFFYDGALATSVAFERLLLSGENFAHRLLSRFDPEGDSGQLMHVATDGESYGHHHSHGDMALAYALEYIEQTKLARLTNYGEYFALHPPTQEVQVHEKSSWSCVHGVSRWEDNCGCNSGSHRHWNQNWRRPLRAVFDWLRDELGVAYEREAKKLLTDPWRARDDYIDVLLERSPATPAFFLSRQTIRPCSLDDAVRVLRLLEMQRHLMLMYTSCGWFFDEPTGPETIQVLQYAARAVQLGQQLFGADHENEFLHRLESLQSNIPEFGNGRNIYERFVRRAMLDLPGVAAHYAISSFFEGYESEARIYSYGAQLRDLSQCEAGSIKFAAGEAQITSHITQTNLDFNFAVLYSGAHNLTAGVCPAHREFGRFVDAMRVQMSEVRPADCLSLLHSYFGGEVFSLNSLFHDERRRIVGRIVDSTLSSLDELYRGLYQDNTDLIGFLREIQMPMPAILRASSEFMLQNAVTRCLAAESIDFSKLRELLKRAEDESIPLDSRLKSEFRNRLGDSVKRWANDPLNTNLLTQVLQLVRAFRGVPDVDFWAIQNKYYELIVSIAPLNDVPLAQEWLSAFEMLGSELGVAVPPFLCAADTESSPRPPGSLIGNKVQAGDYQFAV